MREIEPSEFEALIGAPPSLLNTQVLMVLREELREVGEPMDIGQLIIGCRPSLAFRVRGAVHELEIRGLVEIRGDRRNLGGRKVQAKMPTIWITAEGLKYLDELERLAQPDVAAGLYL